MRCGGWTTSVNGGFRRKARRSKVRPEGLWMRVWVVSVVCFKRLLFPSGRCGPCQQRGHHGVPPSLCAFVPGALSAPPNVRALKPGTSKCISTPCDNTGQFGVPHRHLWHLLRCATSLANVRGQLLARATVLCICTYTSFSFSFALLLLRKSLWSDSRTSTSQGNKEYFEEGGEFSFYCFCLVTISRCDWILKYEFSCWVTQCMNEDSHSNSACKRDSLLTIIKSFRNYSGKTAAYKGRDSASTDHSWHTDCVKGIQCQCAIRGVFNYSYLQNKKVRNLRPEWTAFFLRTASVHQKSLPA